MVPLMINQAWKYCALISIVMQCCNQFVTKIKYHKSHIQFYMTMNMNENMKQLMFPTNV